MSKNKKSTFMADGKYKASIRYNERFRTALRVGAICGGLEELGITDEGEQILTFAGIQILENFKEEIRNFDLFVIRRRHNNFASLVEKLRRLKEKYSNA